MYRIGLLWGGARTSEVEPVVTAFLDEVGRHGFIEGKNLTVDYRAFALHPDRLSEYAAELVKGRVDVIGATGNLAIRAAQEATKTIPILGITDDLLGSELVNSMARPNGNTTGVSILAGDLDGKRQDILIEALPGLRRMAALADSNMSTEAKLDVLEEAARARNIELSIHRIATGEEIAAALDRAKASGATALNVLASPLLWTNRRLIMDRAAALRLPAIYEWAEMAEEGGFVAYGPHLVQIFRELVRLSHHVFE
jgi:putative ABC transport system substrate-binding protein